jgi:hypothetical protein
MPTCLVQCIPVTSSWIEEIILTENCNLAVWFKNGFCCVYPQLDTPWFENMLVAPSKGHFHRSLIYKRFPYQAIRPPCPPLQGVTVPCCPNPIPPTLYATVTNAGVCNGTYPLTHSVILGIDTWQMNGTFGSCGIGNWLKLTCTTTITGNAWSLESLQGGGGPYAPTSAQCSPIDIIFQTGLLGCGSTTSGPQTTVEITA